MVDYDDAYEAGPRATIAPGKVIRGLDASDFRKLAHAREVHTHSGAAAYLHRAGPAADEAIRNNLEQKWNDADAQRIEDVHRLIESLTLLQVDLRVGRGESSLHARVFVPPHRADLAYMAARTFEPAPAQWPDREKADITIVVLPDWTGSRDESNDSCVLVDTECGVTYILGSDGYGEIHGGILRLAMHRARRADSLGLHGAAVQITARRHATGELETCGVLLCGPDRTGKTTLACHDFDLDLADGEKARVRQDAVVLLDPSGAVRGTTGRGFYVRTEELNLEDHIGLYEACACEEAVLENVWVHSDGSADFYDTTLSREPRAVASLNRITGADGEIDLPALTHLFFLTHNPWLPPVIKLTPEQATAAFMLGESVEIETGPDDEEGVVAAAQRLVGANPLRLGAEEEEGAFLYDFLKKHPEITTCLLNTGRMGLSEDGKVITLRETATIIREICRGGVEWSRNEQYGFSTATKVPELSADDLPIETWVEQSELDEGLEWLRSERRTILEEFERLPAEVRDAVY